MLGRTYQDLKQWNPLINRIYYERNQKDPTQIRTYTMKWNGLAQKISPVISNWHTAEPTPEMYPYHPQIMRSVMCFQSERPDKY